MKAYWIAFVDVTQPEHYQDYLECAPAVLKAYNARILARGGQFTTLEGFSKIPSRAVVLEFDNYEQALACYHSQNTKPQNSIATKHVLHR